MRCVTKEMHRMRTFLFKNINFDSYKDLKTLVEKHSEGFKTNRVDVDPKLDKLSISKSKWIYMDAFNYLRKFYDGQGNHWNVLEIVPRVQDFVDAARNSGWEIKVFVDAITKTDEAKRKWDSRREKEVRDGTRNIPQGMNTLIGDAFRQNDDTLAAYAQRDNADILSGDSDFFRYIGLTSKIYGDFKVNNKQLKLKELEPNSKVGSERSLISPPPKTMDKDLTLLELSQGIYRRGAPSPLVRLFGNPHLNVRPLRQALYCRKNITGSVSEIFPVWSDKDNKVMWTEDTVTPDKSLDDLLDHPEKAMEAFFPKSSLLKPERVSDFDWHNHLYAIHSVVYELCALANRDGKTFLQMFEPKIIEFQSLSKALKHGLIKDRPTKKPDDLPLAYKFECRHCKEIKEISGEEVLFYQKKGFDMPKQCKACKQAKSTNNN